MRKLKCIKEVKMQKVARMELDLELKHSIAIKIM